MRTTIVSTLALALLAGAAAAQSHADAPPAVSVSYADLKLGETKDAAIMLKRIERAAADACRQAPGFVGVDTETILRTQACARDAVDRAVAGLNAPKVTAAYDGQVLREQLARAR
jgi:UrcA family protein